MKQLNNNLYIIHFIWNLPCLRSSVHWMVPLWCYSIVNVLQKDASSFLQWKWSINFRLFSLKCFQTLYCFCLLQLCGVAPAIVTVWLSGTKVRLSEVYEFLHPLCRGKHMHGYDKEACHFSSGNPWYCIKRNIRTKMHFPHWLQHKNRYL